MLSLNRYRLRHLAKQGHRGALRTSALLARPDRLLGTILVGNNFVNILASSIATVLAIQLWGEAGIASATLGGTLLLLICGEITQETLGALHPELIAYPTSRPLTALHNVLSPVVALLGWVSNVMFRLSGLDPTRKRSDILSNEELRSVLREAGQGLSLDRRNMLLGVLDLETINVDDVMVPCNEVLY